MTHQKIRHLCFGVVSIIVSAFIAPTVEAASEQQELVMKAATTFNDFERDPNMKWFRQHIGRAEAVLIAPKIVKAGFILGGSGGRAVLFARDPQTGEWRGPAFYSLFTPSIGLQVGVEVSEMVTLIMTEKALDGLLSTSLKMGADATVAAGPVGEGAESNVKADMIAYVRSKGIYGGVDLDGSLVKISEEWNEAFYGRYDVLPVDVLIRGTVSSDGGAQLRAMLTAASAGQ